MGSSCKTMNYEPTMHKKTTCKQVGCTHMHKRKYKKRKLSLNFLGIVSKCMMKGMMQVANGCLLLLWKQLLVRYCAGNCSCFFSIYCITSFSDYTHLRHQETTQKFKHETPLFLYCWIHILKFSGTIFRITKKLQYNCKILKCSTRGEMIRMKIVHHMKLTTL